MEKKGLKHPKIFLISTVPFSRDKDYACESSLYIFYFSVVELLHHMSTDY